MSDVQNESAQSDAQKECCPCCQEGAVAESSGPSARIKISHFTADITLGAEELAAAREQADNLKVMLATAIQNMVAGISDVTVTHQRKPQPPPPTEAPKGEGEDGSGETDAPNPGALACFLEQGGPSITEAPPCSYFVPRGAVGHETS